MGAAAMSDIIRRIEAIGSSSIQPWPVGPSIVAITGDDGTELLAILSNGTVRGTIENAGPAAERFMTALRGLAETIEAQAKTEALAEVAEWETEADASIRCAANLRESTKQADRQEADKYEHHATIARNLAARMRATIERKSE